MPSAAPRRRGRPSPTADRAALADGRPPAHRHRPRPRRHRRPAPAARAGPVRRRRGPPRARHGRISPSAIDDGAARAGSDDTDPGRPRARGDDSWPGRAGAPGRYRRDGARRDRCRRAPATSGRCDRADTDAAAAPTDAPAPSPAGARSSTASSRDWPDIVRAVSPATRAVLAECRPIAVDGNVVTLGLPGGQGVPQGPRRAPPVRPRGRHRWPPRAGRQRPDGRHEHRARRPAGRRATDLLAEARRIFADDLVDVGEVS